jgi:hypothetical protein
LPEATPFALTNEFLLDGAKRTQWTAFCKRIGMHAAASLDAIGPTLIGFLMPAIEQARLNRPDTLVWAPHGPWQNLEVGTP